MATTTHLGITLLETAQAQKEVTVNEALARFDAVLNCGVIDKDLATPPASPQAGDVYIVASSATGIWAGKSGHIAYFDQGWRFIVPNEGVIFWVKDEDKPYVYNGSYWQLLSTSSAGVSAAAPMVAEGRLSLSDTLAVTVNDMTNAASVYYTPYRGSNVALYVTANSQWQLFNFATITIPVPSVANTNYDVFLYNNAGVAAAETIAWSSDAVRATALALQNGVYVKSGDVTRRYVGTFRTTSVAGKTEDSVARRFVWNYHNRVNRTMLRTESTPSWTYSTAVVRQANNNSANQLNFVVGVNEDVFAASMMYQVSNNTASPRQAVAGIGVNNYGGIAPPYCGVYTPPFATAPIQGSHIISGIPAMGANALIWLEYGAGADTQTWTGSGVCGLQASLLM
jgi:Protein of unknown function (DUF2793)